MLTPDDWNAWRQLRLAALAEAPEAFGSRLADWQGEHDREERWRARLAIPGSVNVVAVLDGQPAGMVSGVPASDGPASAGMAGDQAAELISMWVSPAARGRGVGDRLMTAVEQWALRAGAEVLLLAVYPANENAVGLYRRHGFRDTGPVGGGSDGGPGPDGARPEHRMVKTLSPLTPPPVS